MYISFEAFCKNKKEIIHTITEIYDKFLENPVCETYNIQGDSKKLLLEYNYGPLIIAKIKRCGAKFCHEHHLW